MVCDQPRRKPISWANNSPKPSISPLTNGSNRFIAAPLNNDQTVGGWYIITGCSPLLFDCGGEDEGGDNDEYGSESEGSVRPDADRSCGGDGNCSSRSLLYDAMTAVRETC